MLHLIKLEVLIFLEKHWVQLFTIGLLIGAFIASSEHIQTK